MPEFTDAQSFFDYLIGLGHDLGPATQAVQNAFPGFSPGATGGGAAPASGTQTFASGQAMYDYLIGLGHDPAFAAQAAQSGFPSWTPPAGVTVPGAGGTGGGDPAAFGFPLFQSVVDLILKANEQKIAMEQFQQQMQFQREGRDLSAAQFEQQFGLSTAQLLTELDRTSPTRAAELAVRLGLPTRHDFSFANAFAGAGNLSPSMGGFFGGNIAGQNVSLPGTLSGQQLSFLSANQNVANVIGDIASRFGKPDLFQSSAKALIPTSASLLGMVA